jgi:hypothetical protein
LTVVRRDRTFADLDEVLIQTGEGDPLAPDAYTRREMLSAMRQKFVRCVEVGAGKKKNA